MKYYEIIYDEDSKKYLLFEKGLDKSYGYLSTEDFKSSMRFGEAEFIARRIQDLCNIVENEYEGLADLNGNISNAFIVLKRFNGKNNDINLLQFYWIDESKIKDKRNSNDPSYYEIT